MASNDVEFSEESDTTVEEAESRQFSEAVLHTADWTVETIVSQLTRGNIEMNPRFQRRDAWSPRRKSAFIESLVLGLPVPQIVLAEKRGQRGKYIVLDGKQRLLSLLQFTGSAEGSHNAFRLSGLEARTDLSRKTYQQLQGAAFESDLNAFLNYTIRTVVIRNWPNIDFLHLVFLRLNTGSVKLSPQELRQAMFPGAFSDFVDEAAGESEELKRLLHREDPDPRMRDVELLVRYLGFRLRLNQYAGRMKSFLDATCGVLNNEWQAHQSEVEKATADFNAATGALMRIFGDDSVARKADSRSFNRAVFDALVFYASNSMIRQRMIERDEQVRAAYDEVLQDGRFQNASESDTAGVPNTLARLRIWGEKLHQVTALTFVLPELRDADPTDRTSKIGIRFDGFGL